MPRVGAPGIHSSPAGFSAARAWNQSRDFHRIIGFHGQGGALDRRSLAMPNTTRPCIRFTGAHSTVLSEDRNSLRFDLGAADLEIPVSRIDAIIQYLATAKRLLDRTSSTQTMIENEEYKRIMNDLFSICLDKPQNADLRFVPGSICPAKLVLGLQVRPELKRALVTPERGAILEIDMAWEVVKKVYEQIWRLAQTTDLPLPKLDKDRA
jgi:hypothetical protein